MRRCIVCLALLVCGLPICAMPQKPAAKSLPSQSKNSPQPMEPKQILQREAPGIVTIYAVDKSGKPFALGTGFIVRSNGVVVTNFHVVKDAYDAQVKLKDGEIYEHVRVLDYDERRDVIILKISALDLATVTLGDSSGVEAGDRAYAIGNPEGLSYTISEGLISARRIMQGSETLQISVPISHGSSGGPLYNTNGQVIGITAAGMEEGQNLNFAVPIKYVLAMLDSAPRNMTLVELFPEAAQPKGTRETPSAKGTPAGPHEYTDPDGWLALTFPATWQLQDPAPQGMMLGASKADEATLVAFRSDAKNAEAAFNDIRKVLSDKYSGLNKYSEKVSMDYKDGRRLRMQTFMNKAGTDSRLLFILATQHDNRVVGMLGIFTNENSYHDLNDILKTLEF